jgi:hypothetical protein
MREYWISNKIMTFWCKTKDGIIVDSAPIVKKFIGQPLSNFIKWSNIKIGKTDIKELS